MGLHMKSSEQEHQSDSFAFAACSNAAHNVFSSNVGTEYDSESESESSSINSFQEKRKAIHIEVESLD